MATLDTSGCALYKKEDKAITTMIESCVMASYSYLDMHGENPDPVINLASIRAIRQLLSIKAHQLQNKLEPLEITVSELFNLLR